MKHIIVRIPHDQKNTLDPEYQHTGWWDTVDDEGRGEDFDTMPEWAKRKLAVMMMLTLHLHVDRFVGKDSVCKYLEYVRYDLFNEEKNNDD